MKNKIILIKYIFKALYFRTISNICLLFRNLPGFIKYYLAARMCFYHYENEAFYKPMSEAIKNKKGTIVKAGGTNGK